MKIRQKINNAATLAFTALMLPTVVSADGTLSDAKQALDETGVWDRLSNLASMAINVAFFVAAIISGFRAVWYFVQSMKEGNPSSAQQKQQTAINSGIACAVSVVGGLLVNALLAAAGLGGIFTVK